MRERCNKKHEAPTHLIKNWKPTHDGRVTKDRLDDGCRMTSSYYRQLGFWMELGSQRLPGGKQ